MGPRNLPVPLLFAQASVLQYLEVPALYEGGAYLLPLNPFFAYVPFLVSGFEQILWVFLASDW